MDSEARVVSHYSHGRLEAVILEALRASGVDVTRLSASDLVDIDEFHLGWRPATVQIGQDLELAPGQSLLDIGCGIGGPARHFAEAHGCAVTGVDLTEEFVQVARALSERCGLGPRETFLQASARALPFPDAHFDAATLIHVGMNLEDKAAVFAEARRVLPPGARFVVYDVMRTDPMPLPYPMPWAETADAGFVETPETYRRLLGAQGFEVTLERNQRELTLELARQMRGRAAQQGAPTLGLHLLMGPRGAERLANVMSALTSGSIAPIELVARAR